MRFWTLLMQAQDDKARDTKIDIGETYMLLSKNLILLSVTLPEHRKQF